MAAESDVAVNVELAETNTQEVVEETKMLMAEPVVLMAEPVEPAELSPAPVELSTLDYDAPTPIVPEANRGYGSGKLGLYEFKFGPFTMNPIVAFVGAAVLWTFTIWCITDDTAVATMKGWKVWVTQVFSWYYIATQNIWIIFMLVVMYKFGDRKLGKDDEKPEFGNVTYFAMLFSAGVAIGLVVYGTAEPLYHYDYWVKQRFNADPATLDNDKANFALLLTLWHWGLHGWVPYALVGVQLGVMSFRHGLPLLMRTAFYPILGKHTWGWIGDAIDSFTIVTIVSGVCTSLGLGVWQITVGFEGLDWLPENCGDECHRNVYLLIIWGITLVATASVLSGLSYGIKSLSQVSVVSAAFIWLVALFIGDTWFYLNNMTQMVGYYLQYSMTQLGWHTDAFAQRAWGEGGTPDQLGASKPVEGSSFMDAWTIFYWGWWIAWCPFVGIFIARISRGRTVTQVICYSLGGPLLTSLLWFGLFGGMAIGMENNAQLLWQAGSDLYNDPTTFQTGHHNNPQAAFKGAYLTNAIDSRDNTGGFGTNNGRCGAWDFDPNPNVTKFCDEKYNPSNPIDCIPAGAENGKAKACAACFIQQATFARGGMTGCEIFEANPKNANQTCPKYIQYWKGNTKLSPVCLFTDWAQETSWYNTMGQLGAKVGPFLQVVSIISLILFFVTSSDSGSLVVDTIAANGRDECSVVQRVFWAFTEGALATGLVAGAKLGNEKSVLQALQAASICTGLPYTMLLCFLMPAIWRGFDLDNREANGYKTFKTPIYGGIFDTVEFLISLGKCPLPVAQIKQFFISGFFPFLTVYSIAGKTNNKIAGSKDMYAVMMSAVVFALFISWIVLLAISTDEMWAIGWVMYISMAFVIGNLRREVREGQSINGNFAEDIFGSIFMYPNVLVQVAEAQDEPQDGVKEN